MLKEESSFPPDDAVITDEVGIIEGKGPQGSSFDNREEHVAVGLVP